MGYSRKRARRSLKPFRNQLLFNEKAGETESLIHLHKEGFIDLYFGDGSHFCLTPNIPYAWQHKDHQILLPSRKSKRLTVFGLLTIDPKIEHYTTESSIETLDSVTCPDDFCKSIIKKTVIVPDNAPIHRSKLFKYKQQQWEEQDLYILSLPPYSPELNNIEILWRFIKYKRLPPDAFLNFNNLKERLNDVLNEIGKKYVINFY